MPNIGFVIAGLCYTAIIPTVVAMMWPTIAPSLGWAIIAIAAIVGSISLTLGFGWKPSQLWPRARRLALTEAARLIYAKASPALREVIRTPVPDASNSVEAWGRNAIQICGSSSLISLRGRRGPGLPYEDIPSEELENLWVREDDSLGGPGGTPPDYIEVTVSRRDALRVLANYEEGLTHSPSSKAKSKISTRATPNEPKTDAPKAKQSGVEWNIAVNPERVNFLGLSIGKHGEMRAHHFWLRGWNKSDNPIRELRAYIRAENTAAEYEGLFNPGNGKLLPASEIEIVPVGAMMDITVPFRPNREPIPLSTFLAEVVPFTFFFVAPGIAYRQTFTREQIEHRIAEFQKVINDKAMSRPQMQVRRSDEKRE